MAGGSPVAGKEERMIVPRKTRAVSTREAQRHLSQLLDEIDREESVVLIVRYGRPAAMLIPFEETAQSLSLPRP
jgi:prevent-host-death family protein